MMALPRWLALALLALPLVGCGSDDDRAPSGDAADAADGAVPLVVATTSIWADVVRNTACQGMARVETLIPVGADAHGFEPSLADRARLQEAALIVANGLQLEESVIPTLDAAAGDGVAVFTVADHVPLGSEGEGAPTAADDDHDDDHDDAAAGGSTADEDTADHGHDDGVDPHLWFDPTLVSSAVAALGDVLVSEAGLDAEQVQACVDDYRRQLDQLDAETAQLVDQVPEGERLLVTNHAALGYFAQRYGFEIVGTVLPSTSTMAETNPAALEELARAIDEAGVPAIFTESGTSAPDAEALASRLGDVEIIELPTESLGAEGSGAESYVDLIRTTAERIVDGLSGA